MGSAFEIIVAAPVVVGGLLVTAACVCVYRVRGGSMTPTIPPESVLLVLPAFRRPPSLRVGDVVVVAAPGTGGRRWWVKRIAAIHLPERKQGGHAAPGLFLLGDHPVSRDSRTVGLISAREVRGRVLGVVTPTGEARWLGRRRRPRSSDGGVGADEQLG